MEILSWIMGLYVIPLLLGTLVMKAENHAKHISWSSDNNVVFCPVVNIIFYIVIPFYIFNLDEARTEINPYIASLNLELPTFLDEESQREMKQANEEYKLAISAARLKFMQQQEEIKGKSQKRKLCNQLGLTLDDLDSIKKQALLKKHISVMDAHNEVA